MSNMYLSQSVEFVIQRNDILAVGRRVGAGIVFVKFFAESHAVLYVENNNLKIHTDFTSFGCEFVQVSLEKTSHLLVAQNSIAVEGSRCVGILNQLASCAAHSTMQVLANAILVSSTGGYAVAYMCDDVKLSQYSVWKLEDNSFICDSDEMSSALLFLRTSKGGSSMTLSDFSHLYVTDNSMTLDGSPTSSFITVVDAWTTAIHITIAVLKNTMKSLDPSQYYFIDVRKDGLVPNNYKSFCACGNVWYGMILAPSTTARSCPPSCSH